MEKLESSSHFENTNNNVLSASINEEKNEEFSYNTDFRFSNAPLTIEVKHQYESQKN